MIKLKQYGFDPEGGTKNFNFYTPDTHSSLGNAIALVRGVIRPKDGCFFKAESFYAFISLFNNTNGDIMKTKLEKMIKRFVENYPENMDTKSKWGEPLVTYADANDEDFYTLKKVISPTHAMPKDFLFEAKTVVTYFIPFDESIPNSNINERYCSKEWAIAYIETNKLILDINIFVKNELEKIGHMSNIIPATHNFDEKKLISDWSHRHVAVIAGLGTFGLNNMLITEKGCCGRVGSFVTDIKINPTPKIEGENCLYKSMNICKKCVSRCVNDALKTESFNRYKCYEMCLDNDRYHSDLGLVDICGKCLVNVPCATKNPRKL